MTEIIEVQLAETTGAGEDLVKFGEGHTILTLHFQRKTRKETRLSKEEKCGNN